ncbi:MAG: tripartite tricarboxylate transporter substrate binding protein [Hydrogenophaga sp.]|jgi:tripartite-type tricarboxylate transporter receptor subunit TctC|uniref:tripartite tricarboxylate transporter substrate binding protein n=2 Tax=Hydrogenophaga sp. TaxID=1904254 RepID=UPI00271F687F|nr:tripartite tricarboxylate transporter substrate binding protein [Hydrogenophaga sp.]MDO8889606.1 tripartite tricarboxylate transporter substrate binding protein [Hydrogenophaga sp.]MDO9505734.1 tripartite tricarboxylate transporter substrate binding protein [Hydrogenophaga sp.]MDP1781962.1 tripartite tricarboxylate transporter substrate binding protein [Hydrogenophaga sp.]MDP2986062.1 tripartite tricarboxylate transporter substrate binding protein [Hydrogenophaga sp.]MDP3205995.1 tripartite
MNRQLRSLCLAAVAATAAVAALAQDAYPSKPITMVVPFPPGGVADTVGRPVAEAMGKHLNQTVVVVNRGGAGGGIGMAQVAKAAPDGYTMLMALSSVVVLPEADKILNRAPMFELNQLLPIARITADPTVLVVRADSPWKTYADFIAHARANPSRITFGSSGNYGTMHVPMEQLKSATSTFMLHVPYTGAGPALLGLLSGQIDAVASGPASVAGQIKAGKMRALAHWGEGRLALLPDVPSFKELGVPISYSQWSGIFVPAGTPPDVVTRLREAARAATRDERTIQVMTTAGTSFQFQDAPEFDRFVKDDASTMLKVVKQIGRVN